MFDNRILHIEDNFHNRRIVRKILEKQGYVLHEAADGIIGFNMIKEFTPPVVLLDISLPGMDGIEIAQRVKADDQYKHIILIAVTASAMQGDRERFLAAGCDDYLSKPFRSIDLIEIVNQHFEDLRKKASLEETIDTLEEPLEPPAPAELSETFDTAVFQALEEYTQKLDEAETAETPEPELETSQEENELFKTASLQALYAGQLPEEEMDEPTLEMGTPEEAEQEEVPSEEAEEADDTLRLPSIKSLNEVHKFKSEEKETPEPESAAPMEMSESLDTPLAQEIEEDVSKPTLEVDAPEEVKDPPTTASFRDWMSSETVMQEDEIEELEEEEIEETPAPVTSMDEAETIATPSDWLKEVEELELEEEETLESESVEPAETGELTDLPFAQEIEEEVIEPTLEVETPEEVEEIPTTAPLGDWASPTTETEQIETKELTEIEEIHAPVTSMDEAETITTPSDWLKEVEELELEEEEYLEPIEASHDDIDVDTRPLKKPKRDRKPVKEPASTKTRASKSDQPSEILSKLLGMINPETLRPVDPNVDFDSA